MLEQPDLVAEVHRDFCDAGANIACLNTYAITHARLARGQNLPPIVELLDRARELGEQGAAASQNTGAAMIASLPPLVASYRPDTQLPLEQAISEYRELIALQKETVDGFLAETIPSISEA
jgi:homocysteine S-methyltransferase